MLTTRFIRFLTHRLSINYLLEFDIAVFRSKNDIHVRIPFEYHFILFYQIAVFLEDSSSIRNIIVHKILTVFVYNMDLGVSCKGYPSLFSLFCNLESLVVFDYSSHLGVHLGSGCDDACDTADVERTKSQLRSRLTDTLGSHDAYRLADVRHLSCGEISTIAANAKTAFGFAGQR